MQPHLQPPEIEPMLGRHHDLAIDDNAARQLVEKDGVQVGEIAVEGPQVATLDVDVVRAAEHDRAETVPFGLEQEVAVTRHLVRDFGEHRFDGWRNSHALN